MPLWNAERWLVSERLHLPEECIEVRGRRCTSTSFTLFLPLQWLGGAVAGWTVVAAAGTVHRPPRLLEVGQEAEFYMVHDDPPSTRGGGGGGGRLAVRIVRPLPWGLVVFKRAMAAGATGVAEECPSGVGGRRGAGGAAVRVILIDKIIDHDGDKDGNGDGSASLWWCWLLSW